jgi:hypothetical protein
MHMDVLVATDFFTTEVWTWCGLVTYYTRDLIRGRAMSRSFPCPAQLGGLQARFSVAHDWGAPEILYPRGCVRGGMSRFVGIRPW